MHKYYEMIKTWMSIMFSNIKYDKKWKVKKFNTASNIHVLACKTHFLQLYA